MLKITRIALALGLLAATQAQAGLFDDDEARRQIADLRIKTEARFDQQSKAQMELVNQLQRQVEEIAKLRGQIETLNYELETLKKRQQDFYLDLDARLRKFEGVPSTATTGNGAEGDTAHANANPASSNEGPEYDAALNQFKAAKYKEAASAFAAFVHKYPDSPLASNAQYWLGNAWYAQGNCTKAIETQGVVTSRYANSARAPDAWLAIATCQKDLGNTKGMRRSLEALIDKYPGSQAAETARQRLKK